MNWFASVRDLAHAAGFVTVGGTIELLRLFDTRSDVLQLGLQASLTMFAPRTVVSRAVIPRTLLPYGSFHYGFFDQTLFWGFDMVCTLCTNLTFFGIFTNTDG